MVAKLNQPQTSIVDLPEEDRELTTGELLFIVGGAASEDCEKDTTNTGNRDCDRMN